MSSDEPHDDDSGTDRRAGDADRQDGGVDIDVDGDIAGGDAADDAESQSARDRLEAEADRAVSEFDEGIVDLLAWLLDTETRARIYVYLRKNPHSTSEEVADGTGLYPSTVREALAELHEEDTVSRRKRESAGAGNNPYEYTAIAPSDLVRSVAEQVQSELNTVFNLDRHLGGADEDEGTGPVSITVGEADGEAESESESQSESDPEPESAESVGDGTDADGAGDGDRSA